MLWEKEKMLFTGIFSFSCNVFKRFVFQGHYKSELFGKILTVSQMIESYLEEEGFCNKLWESEMFAFLNNTFYSKQKSYYIHFVVCK